MINWGLIGCGEISQKRVAPAIKGAPKSRIIAAMSPFEEELNDFVEKFAITKKYTKIEDILGDEEINAVYIATPVFTHYELALAALKSGKHVLLEKPMAMTNEQCHALVTEAAKGNVKLGIAYYRRFFPKMAEVKKLIREGVIGEIIQVRILYHSWRGETDSWRVKKSQSGGGPLWDMGCHKIDMLIDLVGMPVSASALMSTLTHSYEVEDSCSMIMELENGAHCLASFNWNSKVWSDEFEILGTDGKIVMNPCDSDNLQLIHNPEKIRGLGKEITTVSLPNHSNIHYPLVEDFVHAVLENRCPVITGEEGYKTNRVLAAIEESIQKGKRINI